MKYYLYLMLACALAAGCMEQPGEGKATPEGDPADAAATELEQMTLTRVMAFDNEADSIINAAETLLEARRQEQHSQTVHHREKNRRTMTKAGYHLDQLKKIKDEIGELEVTTEPFSQALLKKLETLVMQFGQEKTAFDQAIEELPNQETGH